MEIMDKTVCTFLCSLQAFNRLCLWQTVLFIHYSDNSVFTVTLPALFSAEVVSIVVVFQLNINYKLLKGPIPDLCCLQTTEEGDFRASRVSGGGIMLN